MIKRFAITVSGRVQGVGFRYFAEDIANCLGLSGWVRNNFDRTVECEAQGEETVLDEFCTELRKGPPLSHVKDIHVLEIPVVNDAGPGFVIEH